MARITHLLYGDEAGDLTTKPVFVLGVVKVRAELDQQIERDLEAICEVRGFTGEIKSTSTYHATHALRLDFIDLFTRTDGLEFRCLVTTPERFDIHRYARNSLGIARQDLAYNYLYRQVIQGNCSSDERVLGYLDDKSRSRNDNLFESLVREIPTVADIQPRNSKDVRLLQLADVLSGCVFNELTDGVQPLKRATREYALQKLGITSFRGRGLGSKFNVWHFRQGKSPTFT